MSLLTLKYIELKSGCGDCGPAWIARVATSKSGQTVYFNGKALKRAKGGGISGNHFDIETGEEYWISGVKKRGSNRHWAGSGKVQVAANVVAAVLELWNEKELDQKCFVVTHTIQDTDPSKFA